MGFELTKIILDYLGTDDYFLISWFAKQQSVSRWGPSYRVFNVVAALFMLTATTTGRTVERSTRCHQGGSDMCPARAVPYGRRNQGTRRLPVPQRVHTTGKVAVTGQHNWPIFLPWISAVQLLLSRWLSVTVQYVTVQYFICSSVRTVQHVKWYWCCLCGHLLRLC